MLNPRAFLAFLALLWATTPALGLGQSTCVSFTRPTGDSAFTVSASSGVAPILVSSDDWPGVHRTAGDFAGDIKAVTGRTSKVANTTASAIASVTGGRAPIVVGTLGKSALVDAIVEHAKLDVSAVKGNWEAWSGQVVKNPLPGVSEAYVIYGADKRGTIYALYDHSEQFGASQPCCPFHT